MGSATTTTTAAAAGLHWWTAATRASVEEVEEVMGPLGAPERPGAFGHPHRRVHESGASIFCGSDIEGHPVVINAGGEICEGWTDQLLGWSVDLNAWCTRSDWALDVEPAEEARPRLREMHRAFRQGRCETNMRRTSWDLIQNERAGEGWTLMIGGKHSELRGRVYDRRGPLRIEWQWRPARDVGEVLPELAIDKGPAEMWRSLARQVKWPMGWYQQLLTGTHQNIPHEPRVDAVLGEVLQQLNAQYGTTFWALDVLGLTLKDLLTAPASLRGSQAAKLLDWARSADARGMDGDKLRAEVRNRCRKSK